MWFVPTFEDNSVTWKGKILICDFPELFCFVFHFESLFCCKRCRPISENFFLLRFFCVLYLISSKLFWKDLPYLDMSVQQNPPSVPHHLFKNVSYYTWEDCTDWATRVSCWSINAIVIKGYFWFKYDLGQKYQAPQARPDRGSNSWPPDHDSTFHVTETPALYNTTWPSVISYTDNISVMHWDACTVSSISRWSTFVSTSQTYGPVSFRICCSVFIGQ